MYTCPIPIVLEKLKIDLASGEERMYSECRPARRSKFRDFEMDLTSYAEESWGSSWKDQYMDFCMDLLNEAAIITVFPACGLTYIAQAYLGGCKYAEGIRSGGAHLL